MAEELYRRFERYIREHRMLDREDDVVTGVSGGADSVCLLFLLHRYCCENGCQMTVVHVNHMIREREADSDEAFVRELCRKLDISCISEKTDVPALAEKLGLSEEEAGRYARYEILCRIAKTKSNKIAVAHHREDNAETVLFNLIRGAGVKGLSGMQPVVLRGDCRIIRPLLTESRETIESYLKENQISFRTDLTNGDPEYSRNRLRLNVFPELSKINARATEHICLSAEQLGEIEEYLERETDKQYAKTVISENGICRIAVSKLISADPVIAKRIALRAISEVAGHRKDITAAHVSSVLSLASMQSGRKADLPYGMRAVRSYDEIRIGLRTPDDENSESYLMPVVIDPSEFEKTKVLTIRDGVQLKFEVVKVNDNNRARLIKKNIYTKAFDCDKIIGVITVGEKVHGDKIILQNGAKTLKKYFIDEKIPSEQREKTLILRDEKSVIWIVGYRISEKHKITENTKRALVVSVSGGKNEC